MIPTDASTALRAHRRRRVRQALALRATADTPQTALTQHPTADQRPTQGVTR